MAARELPNKFLVAFSLAGEQRSLVHEIADSVERELGRGTVFFDEWFEHYIAGDDADLRLQEIYTTCELAVVCVSKRYGEKPWTKVEHAAIRARQMQLRESGAAEQQRMLPIRVGDGNVEGILFNAIVPDVRDRSASESARLVIDRLSLIVPEQAGTPSATQGFSWPGAAPELRWPMADHGGVRDAFALLLTRKAPWRFLPLQGRTEVGKSHITRQMLANALRVPGLACGRFDFKGTASMEDELSAFVQELDVALPPVTLGLNGRLGHVLDALKRRARAALLIFDTYEAAGDAGEWVEKQLLPSLVRATWLRVVIAGQSVPKSAGAIWEAGASPTIELKPPPPADWFAYGSQHRPGLTLSFVEDACRLAFDKASVLDQLLGPVS
jgi:TIR domain-containing protein